MIASAIWRNDYFGRSVPVVDTMHEASLLILWGGEDISPGMYGEHPVHTTAHWRPSRRDTVEGNLVDYAVAKKIPILGICRGMQLLAAKNGGKLYQHVENHGIGYHDIVFEGTTLKSNSCHHQMVRPHSDMEILASSPCLSPVKYTETGEVKEEVEPEIVYFPKLKALGVQGHPEWMPKNSDFVQLVIKLCEEKLGVSL